MSSTLAVAPTPLVVLRADDFQKLLLVCVSISDRLDRIERVLTHDPR